MSFRVPQLISLSVASLDFCLFNHAAEFLTIALACERRFEAPLFAWRDIESMPFDFANNIFLLDLALEATKSAFERLVVAQLNFCH